jgi:hypothetical protein
MRAARNLADVVDNPIGQDPSLDRFKGATGWALCVAAKLETTPAPAPAELHAWRDLYAHRRGPWRQRRS